MLSKSKYLRGDKCLKNLWLYSYKRDLQSYSDASMLILRRGTEVGQLAQNYFPDGDFAVKSGEIPSYETAELTKELMQNGAQTIYEATFIYNDTLVAVDLLRREANGWHIFEVKSTNGTKSQHILDVAVQYYVLSGCGVVISDASVMYFDRTYVRRGKLEPTRLFTHQSVLNEVLEKQSEIGKKITTLFSEMLNGSEPIVDFGHQCDHPYECDFKNYCKSLLPEVITTPHPILSNEPKVKKAEIESFLARLKYPLCHLDFETIIPGVPMFDESRPYQQIPFQYSLHLQETPESEVTHYEYLAESNLEIDPRLGLITQMIAETSKAQTILVYNITFERNRIVEMARDFPQYAEQLQTVIDRMIDLMFPFQKKHYTTESLGKKYSIKLVLPLLCPDVSYNELEISNGMDASNKFFDMYFCNDEEYIANTRHHLLKYCHLDTLAMVRILDVLKMVLVMDG